eukprot:4014733-Alexandrium_andersonii.AAC.1
MQVSSGMLRHLARTVWAMRPQLRQRVRIKRAIQRVFLGNGVECHGWCGVLLQKQPGLQDCPNSLTL